MGVSGQLHASAALCSGERTPVPIVQEDGWASQTVWTQRLDEKSSSLCRGSNLDRLVVQSVVRHYILTELPALNCVAKHVYVSGSLSTNSCRWYALHDETEPHAQVRMVA
jgi:hypothetical protein